MASKKRRRHNPRRTDAPVATVDRATAKHAHPEEARRRREAIERSIRRRRLARRATAWGIVAAVVALAGGFVLSQELESRRIASQGDRLAAAAGCTPVEEKPDLGRTHLASGQTTTYEQHPATSGTHDLAPLPPSPAVYTSPGPEQNAVHNLEHGYIVIYYRSGGDTRLPNGVLGALTELADGETKVILAPYPKLEQGTALALAAWDELQQCPNTVTVSQATGLAESFIDRFRGGGKAPEASVP